VPPLVLKTSSQVNQCTPSPNGGTRKGRKMENQELCYQQYTIKGKKERKLNHKQFFGN